MGIELARTTAYLAGYDVMGNWPYIGVLLKVSADVICQMWPER